MPFAPEMTNEQIEQIHILHAQKISLRNIGDAVGCSKDTAAYYINKKKKEETAKLLEEGVAEAASKIQKPSTVFDIVNGLEFVLQETNKLLKLDASGAPLRDKLAVRSELRQLFREARETMESIYNIKLLNVFIEQVTGILESESPGARERILSALERAAVASGVGGIFSIGGSGQSEPDRTGSGRPDRPELPEGPEEA